MHPNPAFRQTSEDTAIAIARARGFGILTAAGPEGPLASHIPFRLGETGHTEPRAEALEAEAHLVRSTALARHLRRGPLPALLIVSGPDGYISPDWYGEDDKVPTWNYVAIHLSGTLRLDEEADMRSHLDRLSAQFEARLAPKPVWTADKMRPETLEGMMRSIVPVRLAVSSVASTIKLNQNRSESARLGAADALAAGGTPGSETAALATLMRNAKEFG